jgi:hypothetical protein
MQFQSIMSTNKVLDNYVGSGLRSSYRGMNEDLQEKRDNLVHQKSTMNQQLNLQIINEQNPGRKVRSSQQGSTRQSTTGAAYSNQMRRQLQHNFMVEEDQQPYLQD